MLTYVFLALDVIEPVHFLVPLRTRQFMPDSKEIFNSLKFCPGRLLQEFAINEEKLIKGEVSERKR